MSDNFCSDFRTMYKNNCVNFSNNSENLVLYRFNVWKYVKWEKKRGKVRFIIFPTIYTPAEILKNFFKFFFIFCENFFEFWKLILKKLYLIKVWKFFLFFFILFYWIKVLKFYFNFHLLYLIKVLKCFFYFILLKCVF